MQLYNSMFKKNKKNYKTESTERKYILSLTEREYEIKNWNSKFQTILDSFETERALSLSLKY